MGKINKKIQNKFPVIQSKDRVQLIDEKLITPKKSISKSKKEKFWQKRRKLIEKIVLTKKQQKEEKARKNRQRSGGIVGDLKPLKDSLPSLSELLKECTTRSKGNLPLINEDVDETMGATKNKLSAKQRLQLKKEKFIRQVTSYEALLKDPDFRKDPQGAIKYHIAQKYNLDNK